MAIPSITTVVRRLLQLAAATLLLSSAAGAAPPLQVAAAADLATCMAELNRNFSAANEGVEVKASVGSSGNFFAQIKNGAPFDVFLSADTFYPRELAKAGLADGATLTVYAHGRLMLWTIDPEINLDAGLSVLRDPRVTRIAIANPDLAPYGRAARAALEKARLWDAVKAKLVFGENIAQTAQFVRTGNAQVGFVGAAHVQAGGRAWAVTPDLYPVLEQGGIVTAKGRAHPAAARYLAYLKSETGRAILRKYGFALPENRAR